MLKQNFKIPIHASCSPQICWTEENSKTWFNQVQLDQPQCIEFLFYFDCCLYFQISKDLLHDIRKKNRRMIRRRFVLLSLGYLCCYHEQSVEGLAAPAGIPRPVSKQTLKSKRRKQGRRVDTGRREQSLRLGNDPLLSLNLNLDSLAKSGQDGAAPRAQEMLKRIQALHKEGYYSAAPDTVSFNSVLNAWARADDDNAAQKAYLLLQTMQDELGRIQPNVVSYNTVILALANNGKPKQAEALLRQMQADPRLKPDTITYNTVAYGWAQCRQKGSAQRAEDLLREMMALSHDGDYRVKPDTVAFNTVLHAWAVSYSPQAASRAEMLLDHMERLHDAGNKDVEPDVVSYTSVIRALSTSREQMAHKKALDLLVRLEKMSQDTGKKHLKPNFVTYTAVITALSKSGKKGAAQDAERLLDRMFARYQEGDKSAKPDVISCSSVIDGWARERSPYGAKKAIALFERMKYLHTKGHEDIKPNAVTYTSVLTALSRSRQGGAAEKGEKLLNEMEELFRRGDKDVEPITICYNAVLDAYGRGPHISKAQKANRLLKKMEQSSRPSMQPDTISYNSVLLACANSFGDDQIKKEAFTIAMERFGAILKHEKLKPTSVTFSLFFKALRKLVPPSEARNRMLKQTFRLCCEAGLLNEVIWSQLQGICSQEHLKSLIRESEVPTSFVSLPSEWTRNAGR